MHYQKLYKHQKTKIMKKTITSILLAFTASIALAQTDYSKSLGGIEWVKIVSKADISVEVHDKNEILIKGSSQVNSQNVPKGFDWLAPPAPPIPTWDSMLYKKGIL